MMMRRQKRLSYARAGRFFCDNVFFQRGYISGNLSLRLHSSILVILDNSNSAKEIR